MNDTGAEAPARAAGLYRKRPVTVEARQLVEDLASQAAIAAWIEAGGGHAEIPFAEPCLFIETLEGRMRADIGDWVVKGVMGEFYPVKPGIFEVTYEPAAGAADAPLPEPRTWDDVADAPGVVTVISTPRYAIVRDSGEVVTVIGATPGGLRQFGSVEEFEAAASCGHSGTSPARRWAATMPDAAPPLSATYARWCRTGPAHLPDRMIAEGWHHKTPAEWEFWTSLDAPPPRPLTAEAVVAGALADEAAVAADLADANREATAWARKCAELEGRLAEAAAERDDLARRIAEVAPMLDELRSLVGQLEGQRAAMEAERDKACAELRGVVAEIDATGITGEGSARSHWTPLLVKALAAQRDAHKLRADHYEGLWRKEHGLPPDLQPDSESESSKALAAKVRAVIARYRRDEISTAGAFADIVDAFADSERAGQAT